MALSRRIVRCIVGGAVVSLLVVPGAQAHERSIVRVEGFYYEHEDKIGGSAELDQGHRGTMTFGLFKMVEGEWAFVARKEAEPATGHLVVWNAFFYREIAGNRMCQIRAKFTVPNHDPAKRRSTPSSC